MPKRTKYFLTTVITLSLFVIAALAIMSLTSSRPDNLGVHNGQLATCPSSPNAVSTQATDLQHKISAIPLQQPAEQAIARLQAIISEFPNTKIISHNNVYLHAEFTSTIFRFVDDVEFFCDTSTQLIHFRSASRVGHSDFGVNRNRMQQIAAAYLEAQQ